MTENKYKFSLLTSNNGRLTIPLTEGCTLFVLGENGVGKSTLMHNLHTYPTQSPTRNMAFAINSFPLSQKLLNKGLSTR